MKNENGTYRGVHFLLGESGALSDSAGSSLLEGNALESLVHVEGVVSGGVLKLLLLSSGAWHLLISLFKLFINIDFQT